MKKSFVFLILIILSICWTLAISQPGPGDVSFTYAKKLYDDKIYDIAAEQFREFAEKNPLSPQAAEALLLAGNSCFNIREYDKAQKEYFYLILRFPDARDLDQAHYKIAECFQALNNFHAAANAYKQVQIFYPKSNLAQNSLFMSAKMSFEAQDYDKTIETVFEFLELFPSSTILYDAHLLLVDAYIKSENYIRAKLELDKILGITQTGRFNADAMLKKANLAWQFGHVQDAEQGYQSLVEKYLKNNQPEIMEISNQALYQLSKIYHQKGMFDRSNETLQKMSNLHADVRSLSLYAQNLFSLKNYANAIDHFKKVIATSDTIHLLPAYFGLGQSFQANGAFVNAIDSYETVIQRFNPNKDIQYLALYEQSHQNICLSYIQMNRPDAGIAYLKRYKATATLNRDFEDIDFQIAYLLETKTNDMERSLRAYYDFMDLYPTSRLSDKAQFGLARCYEKLGNHSQALRDYNAFLQKYPGSQYYFEVQNRKKYLSTYYPSSTNAALQKMSGIIQQLSLEKANPLLHYRIGLTYFNELKDYQACLNMLQQFESDAIAKDEILYYTARCHQLLGEKESAQTDDENQHLDNALNLYSRLIDEFPNSPWSDDAAYHKIEIYDFRKNNLLKDELKSFILRYQDSPFLENAYYRLGLLQFTDGIKTPVDSLDVYRNFESLLTRFPNSSRAEGAKFHQALLLYDRKNYSAAEERLNSFIRNNTLSPFSCQAYYLMGKIAAYKSNFSRSAEYLKHIIVNFYYSDYADSAHFHISRSLVKQEQETDALVYLKKLYQKYHVPDQLYVKTSFSHRENIFQEALFNLAALYQSMNEREQAIQFFQEYLRTFPQGKYADQVLFSLAKLFDTNRREDQLFSIDYLHQIENDFPASNLMKDVYLKLADMYFNVKNYQKANEYYLKPTELSITEDERAYAAARIITGLYRMRQINQADERLKSFERQFKDNKDLILEIKLEKGNYFLEAKEFKEAENIFKSVRSEFRRSSEGARAEFLLGKLYFILNRDKEALEILAELIEKGRDQKILPEVYITLGNFYYLQAKQFDNAILAYRKAVEHPDIDDQNLIIGMNNLIKCYADIQLWDRAISLSRAYIEKFPVNDDTFEKKIQIGYFYYRLKEFDYAIQLFKRLKPEADLENEPRIQYWIAECYFEKGAFQQAIQEYLKIVYMSRPTKLLGQYRVTAQYQSGLAYIKIGKLDNAKQLFQKIILEQGAESVFGKPAKNKIEEIERLKSRMN